MNATLLTPSLKKMSDERVPCIASSYVPLKLRSTQILTLVVLTQNPPSNMVAL